MKIALVHDYLSDYGGAERVLWELHEMFPKAPIYTILVDEKGMGKFWERFERIDVRTSWFGKIPFASNLISPLRFLIPFIWGSFDFSEYDLVITSASWAVTKGMNRGGAREICYVHTPPRYLYGYDESRRWGSVWVKNLVRIYGLIVNHFMRMYDFKCAQRVDYFVANSVNVQRRIEKFYRRDSVVIYPPIEIINYKLSIINSSKDYYLTGGRMVAAKNFDLIIKACNKLKVPLKIFGSGVEEEYLKSIAGGTVEFLGKVSDEELADLYNSAKAFIVAQKDEDFGMTTVEAQSYGCPVIAYRGGGYLETVVEGKTGVFFDDLSVESLVKTIKHFNHLAISPSACLSNAQQFSKDKFKKDIVKLINTV